MPIDVAPEAAIIDLLGALAYGELSAFDRLADDARMAPTLDGRAHMSAMAAVEMGHYTALAERLSPVQWTGAAVVFAGVAVLSTRSRLTTTDPTYD